MVSYWSRWTQNGGRLKQTSSSSPRGWAGVNPAQNFATGGFLLTIHENIIGVFGPYSGWWKSWGCCVWVFFSLLALVPFTSDFGDACTHLERRSNWFSRKFAERGAFAGGLNQRGNFPKEHDLLILVELWALSSFKLLFGRQMFF